MSIIKKFLKPDNMALLKLTLGIYCDAMNEYVLPFHFLIFMSEINLPILGKSV